MSFVIMAPLVMFAVLTVVQVALWLHTRQLAEHAASQAAQLAAVDGGSVESAEEAALAFVDRGGGTLVNGRSVSVETDGTRARAVVVVELESLVPGLSLTVRASSATPIERFVVAP